MNCVGFRILKQLMLKRKRIIYVEHMSTQYEAQNESKKLLYLNDQ